MTPRLKREIKQQQINPAQKAAGLELVELVTGYFPHHVRWGAARHPEASAAPPRLSHLRTKRIFPLFVSLVGGERRRELVAAGGLLAGVFPGTGSLSAGTELGAGRDVFRRFLLSIAQSFR